MNAYYDDGIRAWIKTPEQRSLVNLVRRMTANEIHHFHNDLNEEARLDPPVRRTHAFTVACKAVIRRTQILKRSGATLTGWDGKVGGRPWTVWGYIWRIATLMIVVEVFQGLFKHVVGGIKKID